MLGIFEGKKAKYNKLILKGLVFGPKTTNQIAQYIYLNPEAQVKPKKVNKNRVKRIVSIISRKDSRLDELEAKQYISRKESTENRWHLTPKGMGVALTFYDSIVEIYPYIKQFIHSFVENIEKKLKENPMLQSLGKIERKALKTSFTFVESQDFLQLLKDLTNEMIRQGTDLDKTSLKDFISFVIGKFFVLHFPKIITKGVKP